MTGSAQNGGERGLLGGIVKSEYAALIEALRPWKCCGAAHLCGAACQDDKLSATLARAYELLTHNDAAPRTARP